MEKAFVMVSPVNLSSQITICKTGKNYTDAQLSCLDVACGDIIWTNRSRLTEAL